MSIGSPRSPAAQFNELAEPVRKNRQLAPSALDGCYYRPIMLSELTDADAVFVARPLNKKWVHDLPASYIESQDLKTEVGLNGIYAGEREKILVINKLRDENPALQKNYRHIELIEIGVGDEVQRGTSMITRSRIWTCSMLRTRNRCNISLCRNKAPVLTRSSGDAGTQQ